jgi:small subunit ribosomal protein S24e
MELQIVKNTDNKLVGRQELELQIIHTASATPKRMEVRKEVAKQMKAKTELVIIDHLKNRYGRQETIGYAKVYADMGSLTATETHPILARHGLTAGSADAGKPAAAAAEEPAAEAPDEATADDGDAQADAEATDDNAADADAAGDDAAEEK